MRSQNLKTKDHSLEQITEAKGHSYQNVKKMNWNKAYIEDKDYYRKKKYAS